MYSRCLVYLVKRWDNILMIIAMKEQSCKLSGWLDQILSWLIFYHLALNKSVVFLLKKRCQVYLKRIKKIFSAMRQDLDDSNVVDPPNFILWSVKAIIQILLTPIFGPQSSFRIPSLSNLHFM